MNRDALKGFLIGVLAPIVAFVIYVGFYLEVELDTAIHTIERMGTVTHHISLAVFATNSILFFMHIKTYKEEVARGILGATIVYAFLVMILILI